MRRLFALSVSLQMLLTQPLSAAPVAYRLQPDRSVVAFETDYGTEGIRITGRMPIASAAVTVDLTRVARSSVRVDVDTTAATTSNPLATQAMTGDSVLAVRQFPTIHFESTSVRATGDAAEVTGNITIRGVTRPMTFAARIYRQQGTAEGDRRNLSIILTGAISRSAFGAGGFPDMVGDQVRLKILARITTDG